MKMPTVQWDVVWSMLRTLLVAGGPVATLLIALGFPPVQVSTWLAIGLAVVGVASVAVPGLIGALKRTDSNKLSDAAAVLAVPQADGRPAGTIIAKADSSAAINKVLADPALRNVVIPGSPGAITAAKEKP